MPHFGESNWLRGLLDCMRTINDTACRVFSILEYPLEIETVSENSSAGQSESHKPIDRYNFARCGGPLWDVVAHCGMGWLILRCGGSLWDMLAHCEMRWRIARWGGSFWDVVAHCEMRWRIVRCGGSVWDAVAHFYMWWLIVRCGGSF